MLLTTKEKHMNTRVRKVLLPLFCVGFLAFTAIAANADPVTFSTTGVFSISGTNVVNFTNINGTTTVTFNGTTDSVNTPARRPIWLYCGYNNCPGQSFGSSHRRYFHPELYSGFTCGRRKSSSNTCWNSRVQHRYSHDNVLHHQHNHRWIHLYGQSGIHNCIAGDGCRRWSRNGYDHASRYDYWWRGARTNQHDSARNGFAGNRRYRQTTTNKASVNTLI